MSLDFFFGCVVGMFLGALAVYLAFRRQVRLLIAQHKGTARER